MSYQSVTIFFSHSLISIDFTSTLRPAHDPLAPLAGIEQGGKTLFSLLTLFFLGEACVPLGTEEGGTGGVSPADDVSRRDRVKNSGRHAVLWEVMETARE